ncbi:MAG: SDR family oxidoreductase [Flavobacteriales bacterium]
MNWKDKVVIVTGASSGIGKAYTEAFAAAGAAVVMAARNAEAMEEIRRNLEQKGTRTLVVKADVSQEEDCRILIEKTLEVFGRIDILVNNAGISMRSLLEETDLSVIRRLMDVNFWGMVYCTKYALPHLLASRGSVVSVSSIAGYKGLPARSGYSASKFAMQGFMESLRIENLKRGLHVLIVCPGFTASNIRNVALKGDGSAQGETPRDEGRMMQPEEVAGHTLRAIVRRKNTLILTGQGKMTVLLNKFFPKFMDKMVYNTMAKEPDSPFT